MTPPLNPGISRSRVHVDHALITPESHVPIHLPGWQSCDAIVLISPEMGAGFSQMLIRCQPGAALEPLAAPDEWFLLVLAGTLDVTCAGESWRMQSEAFCYLPPDAGWSIRSDSDAELLAFRKPYVALGSTAAPAPRNGRLADVPAEPFLGDDGALLQTLLPDEPAFDWGINLFEFQPGGTLPQVESHFMEHGLYLLAGQGVYRLGDDWYPVQAGDAIWMGPYLLQWYVAAGKTPSRYIYFKEMNRAPGA